MYVLKNLFQEASSTSDYVSGFNKHMAEVITKLDADIIARVIDVVEQAAAKGNTIYTLANGGSAAVASHFVNDMGVNSLVKGLYGYRVVSLADNVESVTAVANDAGYENIFKFQLECGMVPGDVVIAMSVSGNSENVIRAVNYANEQGGVTVGFCGFDGGRLAEAAQIVVHSKTTKDEYGPVEDVFSILCHLISGYLTMKRGRFLHH